MYQIKEAKIRRMTNLNGSPCAEVEVYSAAGEPNVLAYLVSSPSIDGYELVKVVRSDASMEYDWYDNSFHTAFEDVTEGAFENSLTATAEEEKETFRQQLLSTGSLNKQLNERFFGNGTVM
ncbi:hypothetical protein [Paenibacillus lemnae]|uniref:Uncharacterized protein n=1 Tax=Paenibacillus lemnae TaxID=1330551 RepID=A0A848M2Z1_PAELE|nr:hypothetical protein [Paenibacillus lemnae]NMO95277.1 hypothetical protein [Paenibacillus lemnae]